MKKNIMLILGFFLASCADNIENIGTVSMVEIIQLQDVTTASENFYKPRSAWDQVVESKYESFVKDYKMNDSMRFGKDIHKNSLEIELNINEQKLNTKIFTVNMFESEDSLDSNWSFSNEIICEKKIDINFEQVNSLKQHMSSLNILKKTEAKNCEVYYDALPYSTSPEYFPTIGRRYNKEYFFNNIFNSLTFINLNDFIKNCNSGLYVYKSDDFNLMYDMLLNIVNVGLVSCDENPLPDLKQFGLAK